MPTKVYWYLQNRIIVNEHIGDVSSDTLVRAVEVTLEMANGSESQFHLLIDATELKNVPNDIGELSKIAQALLKNAQLGTVVVVTSNRLHKFIGNLVMQLLRKTSKVVNTREEALQVLERLDMGLSNLSEITPDYDTLIEVT